MDMDIFQELYSCKDLMKVGDNEDADSSSDGDLDHEVEKQPEKPVLGIREVSRPVFEQHKHEEYIWVGFRGPSIIGETDIPAIV